MNTNESITVNTSKRPRTRDTHLYLATYNCRTVCNQSQLHHLIDETSRFQYDIIGLSETKRKDPLSATWHDGTGVYLGARKQGSTSGGVGFLVHQRAMNRVEEVKYLSHRVATLKFKIDRNRSLVVIQVYAPTADKDDQEHAEFYDEVRDALSANRAYYKAIIGDFNARLGPRKTGEVFIGPHSAEARNEAGDRLAAFCETAHFYHANSQFKKKESRRWTHISPNGIHRHELDHILTNRRFVTDVTVIASCHTGSDHRLLRAKLFFDKTMAKLDRLRAQRPPRTILDPQAARIMAQTVQFDEKVDLNDDYECLIKSVIAISKSSRGTAPTHNTSRISPATRKLLEQRRLMKRDQANHVAFTVLSKQCRASLEQDHAAFTRHRLLTAATSRKSIKKAARSISEHRETIPCLKAPDGTRVTSRIGIEKIMREYYTDLFKSNNPIPSRAPSAPLQPPLEFLVSEVRNAVESIPPGKAPGEDGLTAEDIKACGHPLYVAIAKRFTRYINEATVPTAWRSSKSVLLHKKGDKEDLGNYRLITLLPVLYKVFTRCLLARARRPLEEAQPVEQAGFRRGFSTLDHITTLCRVIEATREFKQPLVLTFVDYEKAFDSIESEWTWKSLEAQGVPPEITEVLRSCYHNCTTKLRPFQGPVEVPIGKGVRQGDPISPNLFSAGLEEAIKTCDWSDYGISVDGRRLNHLRFADDIVLITPTAQDAASMLNSLDNAGKRAGLRINLKKTKAMRNKHAPNDDILLGGVLIENVHEYVYLGRLMNMTNDLVPEIDRRRKAAWAAFGSIKTVVQDLRDPKLRADLFNTTVLPALCYGCETWALTKESEDKLRVTQASIERALVGMNLYRQRELGLHNTDIRRMSQVKDALAHADKSKHRWAGHVMRRHDGRWCTALTQWYPYDQSRPGGRPPLRWSDSLRNRNSVYIVWLKHLQVHWSTLAQDRDIWRRNWDPQLGNR